MTDTDKLAQVLAEHKCRVVEFDGCVCNCGTVVTTSVTSTDILAAWPKHQAAVVLAHLTDEGWAQGREEWATAILPDVIYPARSYFHAESDASYFGRQLVRRRVTEWEEA